MSSTPILERAAAPPQAAGIRRGVVRQVQDGATVTVELEGSSGAVECEVLYTASGSPLALAQGDVVLVWLPAAGSRTGVLLGRTGPYAEPVQPVVPAAEFAARPATLMLEAQGDIILRNAQARIRLGADGDIEVVGASYTTRVQRLLRLLAPMIKLN